MCLSQGITGWQRKTLGLKQLYARLRRAVRPPQPQIPQPPHPLIYSGTHYLGPGQISKGRVCFQKSSLKVIAGGRGLGRPFYWLLWGIFHQFPAFSLSFQFFRELSYQFQVTATQYHSLAFSSPCSPGPDTVIAKTLSSPSWAGPGLTELMGKDICTLRPGWSPVSGVAGQTPWGSVSFSVNGGDGTTIITQLSGELRDNVWGDSAPSLVHNECLGKCCWLL